MQRLIEGMQIVESKQRRVIPPESVITPSDRPASLGVGQKKQLAASDSFGHLFAMRVEIEMEEDGRWIAEVPALSGAMAYGQTREEAITHVQALVLRVLADRIEHGEQAPELNAVFTIAA